MRPEGAQTLPACSPHTHSEGSTLPHRTPSKAPHFSVFRSAVEEAEMKVEQDIWDNEGGHMSSASGRVVRTPDAGEGLSSKFPNEVSL